MIAVGRPRDVAKRMAWEGAKRLGKFVLSKALAILAPYLGITAVALVIVCVLVVFMSVTFSAMTSEGALTGPEPVPEDKVLKERYIEIVNRYNTKETWLVEETSNLPLYPKKGKRKLGYFADKNGRDARLKMEWGLPQAVGLFYAYAYNLEKVPEEIVEKAAYDLRPFFYYKESEIITVTKSKDEEGNVVEEIEKQPVKLLVESNTVDDGHYIYTYRWETERHGKTTISYEVLDEVKLLSRWDRLENYLADLYKLDKDIKFTRMMVVEASKGYTTGQSRLSWLIGGIVDAPNRDVPPELVPVFMEAGDKYGIPWWFLAGVACIESSFIVTAENPQTHCYGLMQIMPSNWDVYAPRLGYDPVVDRDNPQAQVDVGAYMLKSYGLDRIDWQGDWQEATLPALTRYGGFVTSGAYSSPQERCRYEYAEKIWAAAEKYRRQGSI